MKKNREAAAAKANGGAAVSEPKKWGTPGVTPSTTTANSPGPAASASAGNSNYSMSADADAR